MNVNDSHCINAKKAGCIIQARLSSERLPGKVLLELGDRPIIDWVVDAIKATGLPLCVATSDDPSDDSLASYLASQGTDTFRGKLHDVLDRIRAASKFCDFDPVIRISADSPFINPEIVTMVLKRFQGGATTGQPSIATNTFPRTFPKGQSVEVISSLALELLHARAQEPLDREHVTRYAYQNCDFFQILSVYNYADESGQNMCIDSRDDLERAQKSIAKDH